MVQKYPIFVLAHNIRSLFNVGSIFRICDVFAIDKLFLSGYTGKPPDSKLQKVALGAENTVTWEYRKSPLSIIKKLTAKYPSLLVVALENNLPSSEKTVELPKFSVRRPVLLILGEEVDGVAKNLITRADKIIEIPQFGTKESLNVAAAFGIVAYVLAIQRIQNRSK